VISHEPAGLFGFCQHERNTKFTGVVAVFSFPFDQKANPLLLNLENEDVIHRYVQLIPIALKKTSNLKQD